MEPKSPTEPDSEPEQESHPEPEPGVEIRLAPEEPRPGSETCPLQRKGLIQTVPPQEATDASRRHLQGSNATIHQWQTITTCTSHMRTIL